MCTELFVPANNEGITDYKVVHEIDCVMVEFNGNWYALMRRIDYPERESSVFVLNAEPISYTPVRSIAV